MQARIVTDINPNGDMIINKLKLAALLPQVLLFTPKMDTLAHTRTAVDNMVEQGWTTAGVSYWQQRPVPSYGTFPC